MGEDALIPIGKIVGTHGIKGHRNVIFYGDSAFFVFTLPHM